MTERLIDLHTHSIRSDGAQTPTEVVKTAAEAGLCAMALSDHDTLEGVAEALEAGNTFDIEVVPAIELSAQCDTELHILGYFINPEDSGIRRAMKHAQDVRVLRQEEVTRKLNEIGVAITLDDVREMAGDSPILCRAHFARVMVDRGYAESVQDAFDRYLACGNYAYSNLQPFSPREAIELIRNAGGIACAAHLHLIRLDDDTLFSFLKELKSYGLSGVEGYYTDYTPEMQAKYQAMARDLDLVLSGGTDYHGKNKPHISIGRGRGNLQIPAHLLDTLKERHRQEQ